MKFIFRSLGNQSDSLCSIGNLIFLHKSLHMQKLLVFFVICLATASASAQVHDTLLTKGCQILEQNGWINVIPCEGGGDVDIVYNHPPGYIFGFTHELIIYGNFLIAGNVYDKIVFDDLQSKRKSEQGTTRRALATLTLYKNGNPVLDEEGKEVQFRLIGVFSYNKDKEMSGCFFGPNKEARELLIFYDERN